MEIGGPTVPNYIISGDGKVLRIKKVDIGAWDMNGVASVVVDIGIDPGKVWFIMPHVHSDSGAANNIEFLHMGINNAGDYDCTVVHDDTLGATSVRIYKANGFVGASYDDAVASRGYLFIIYEE